jgi:hypothetical protein
MSKIRTITSFADALKARPEEVGQAKYLAGESLDGRAI